MELKLLQSYTLLFAVVFLLVSFPSASHSSATNQCLHCSVLREPSHGDIDYTDDNRCVGSAALHSCLNGYRLIGPSVRVCHDDLRWGVSAPYCQQTPVFCSSLSSPRNGHVYYSTTFNSVARYSCDSGYDLVGPSTRTCGENRRWSGYQPTCLRSACSHCSVLREPSHGDIDYTDDNRCVGSAALHSCLNGYRLIGPSVRVCHDDLRWGVSAPYCQQISCSDPSSPSNGHVSYHSTTFNSVARYSCNSGYDLDGPSTRTCGENRRWSGYQPTCLRSTSSRTCRSLSSLRYGNVYYDNYQYVGSVATYSCLYGYRLTFLREGSSSRRQCQDDLRWDGSAPYCLRIKCERLRNNRNDHMAVRASSYYVGGEATYSCSYGYELDGEKTRTCEESGDWSGEQPSCQPISCSQPTRPSNGNVHYDSLLLNSVARYTCDSKYKRKGSSIRTCQGNKEWSGEQPSCQRIECDILGDPNNDHMSISVDSYYVGGSATYSCLYGYEMADDSEAIRTCRISGHWSGTEPSCQPIVISCSPPSSPMNGHVVYNSTTLNSVARYICDSGYRLNGSSTRTCQSDTQWSEEKPSCLRIMCPSNITGPENGTVTVSSYYVSGVATYTCLPGHNMIGSPWRTCEETGDWSGYQPFCQEKCIPSIGFEEPYLRIKEGLSTQVCLTNCSSCIIETNFTVELKTRSQVDGSPMEDDLTVSTEIVLGPDSMCFDVTAVDDNLLEGFEPVSIVMYKPTNQNYNICPDRSVLPVSIVDNDELTVGFETDSMSVDEGDETIEVCVVVLEPNNTIHIPDVVLDVRTWYFGEAKPGDDYITVEARPLPLSDSRRKACFTVEILEDGLIENDEHFSVILERNSTVSHSVPLTIDPDFATLKIMDNDGIIVSFEEYELVIEEETVTIEACIQARFSSSDVSNQFNLAISSQSITAEGGTDFKIIENFPLGTFSQLVNRKCFNVHITGDQDVESDEVFTLEIRGEPPGVVVNDRVMMITIKNDDEPMPCDSYLRPYFPGLFKHCTDSNCEYESDWSKWEETSDSRVEVPREICPSRNMCVKSRWKNSTTEDCDALKEEKEFCVPMKGEKMLQDLGVGISTTSPNSELSSSTLAPETTDSSKHRRSVGNQSHCYSPEEATALDPFQCQAFGSCPYALNEDNSRNPMKGCTKRSVLFVVDSSGSVGEKLFREMSNTLSHLVKHLCGDIQFALLKFSSGAYLEFCFDCFSNDQREDLQARIRNIKYIGHSSFTGYASKCVNNFMFDSSCGYHDDRCIDIVYVTDGESSDSAYFDVCSQVECIHKNPAINDKINIYAINVGATSTSQREVKCITKYSKLSDNSPPIFSFENLDELIVELNTVIREIGLEQHKYRASGQKPKYQCLDWFNGK